MSQLTVIPAKRSASQNPAHFGGNDRIPGRARWIPAPAYYLPG